VEGKSRSRLQPETIRLAAPVLAAQGSRLHLDLLLPQDRDDLLPRMPLPSTGEGNVLAGGFVDQQR
jgi:hypothetical protein